MKWQKARHGLMAEGKRGTYTIFKEIGGFRLAIMHNGDPATMTNLFRGYTTLDAAKKHAKAWDKD